MVNLKSLRVALATGAIVAGSTAVASDSLSALSAIERGRWELKSRANAGDNRTLCLADPNALIQLRHSGLPCQHYVVAQAKTSVTVQYVCTGGGTGRTSVRVETPRLVQIESQGIADGDPFAIEWEGRRTGVCDPKLGAVQR